MARVRKYNQEIPEIPEESSSVLQHVVVLILLTAGVWVAGSGVFVWGSSQNLQDHPFSDRSR